MPNYVCSHLENINGMLTCINWVEAPSQSLVSDLAITRQQSLTLAGIVVTIFIMAYCYKILERNFLQNR